MLLLGIDLGTSSIKVSVVDADTRRSVASISYPADTEREIQSPEHGWAEQDPELWWSDVKNAIQQLLSTPQFNPKEIVAIGITYQMHGLVIVDKAGKVLRPSIIWCDGRAIDVGNAARKQLSDSYCLTQLLNFPGNFTAAKLGWVKAHEPEIYEQVYKMMLPGDYIAMRLTGQITASPSMLSEGVFWDFKKEEISDALLNAMGLDKSLLADVQPVFSNHGVLLEAVAAELGLQPGIPISYKAGDQPNNALSLGVLEPGEIATTAGTSGVIYAVTDQRYFDPLSRVNTFAHVNHGKDHRRLGILLCINGTGISNRWIKQMTDPGLSYGQMDDLAYATPVGAKGLLFLPFGNGSERVLCNAYLGAHMENIDLNTHHKPHLYRAVHEGIAFSFRYGLDIMREGGTAAKIVKAGKANMFLNKTFIQAFVNVTGLTLELYNTDGSVGAALGAGIGQGYYGSPNEAFEKLEKLEVFVPDPRLVASYEKIYQDWKTLLETKLEKNNIHS
ncbi:xylulokinase [Arachidicoccus terrestris]|uniref:xylulokinase n=1 Tax=Arachidicoccus terrestris TaxID=2875539 RepID=UPI001CC3E13B|nr:FGGY family carbohydrate kinase [Arachidicoccus terrestris]UAY57041.1 carbohydrate kinase [Arachidicoccus terrestris]